MLDGLKLSGLPIYLLVDPYFGEPRLADMPMQAAESLPQLQTLRAAGWQRDVCVAQGHKPLISPLQLPYLVALKGLDDDLLGDIAEASKAEAQSALANGQGTFTLGALLETEFPPEQVMKRLERMWLLVVQGTSRYLRVADPRIIEMVLHLWSPDEVARWLGPIARWNFRGRHGWWQAVLGAADQSFHGTDEAQFRRAVILQECAALSPRLPLDGVRIEKLQSSEVVSRTLTAWQRNLANGALPPDAHHRAWAGALAAKAAGLQHIDDLVAFVLRAMQDTGFSTRHDIARAAGLARAAPGSFERHLS